MNDLSKTRVCNKSQDCKLGGLLLFKYKLLVEDFLYFHLWNSLLSMVSGKDSHSKLGCWMDMN